MAAHSNIFVWGNPMDRRPWRATVHGVARVRQDSETKWRQNLYSDRIYISVIKPPNLRYLVLTAQANIYFFLIKMLMVANMWILAICYESDSVMSNSLWPHGLQPARPLCPWDFPGQNTGVGSRSLLQGIFLTQGLKPGLLHWRQILYHLSH